MAARIVIAAVVAALGGACQWKGYSSWPQERATVLEVEEGRRALRQCSRATVDPVDEVWKPTSSDIRQLESRLPMLLLWNAPPLGPSAYVRQYVGVTSRGRRLIYVNLAPFEYARDDVFHLADWRTRAITICDGGANFWGLAYDLESRRFRSPDFNGA